MNDLILLKEKIEKLNKFHQIEITRILNTHDNITLNENKNGIFVNLSIIEKNIIEEIKEYLEYVNILQSDFNSIEKEKNLLSNKFFKYNKDNANIILNEQT
jgi:signal-transduction protein with cAMP-binding, CBS, and nucleotidyltransferase domain